MPTGLFVTVGGSCAPVVTAIKDYQPARVYFIASTGPRGSLVTVDGEGFPCGENLPNIVAQAGLRQDAYQIIPLEEPDSFSDCYRSLRHAMRAALPNHPDWRWIADYTGGTKSMSVALVLAAMELGVDLSLVKGTRTNLVKVQNGTEMAAIVNSWEVRARQRVLEGQRLFNEYFYGPAGRLLEEQIRQAPLSLELQHQLIEQVALCRAFDAWDRFEHARALELLSAYQRQVVPQVIFLKSIVNPRHSAGYELVFDLILNAQRRSAQDRFDDAVARLYRALELLAQTRLKKREPTLDTSNLNLDLLPVALQPKYTALRQQLAENGQDGKLQIGLWRAYGLLVDLGDPLGSVFSDHYSTLLDALQQRNASILAHGVQPVSRTDYDALERRFFAFFQAGLQALGEKFTGVQFPIIGESGMTQRQTTF